MMTKVTDNQAHNLRVKESESRGGMPPPGTEDRIE